MTKLGLALGVLLFVPGCGGPTASTVDGGAGDAGGTDAGGRLDSGGRTDSGVRLDSGDALDSGDEDSGSELDAGVEADGGDDAAVSPDAPPPPVFEALDDGTVSLSHRIGCTPALAFRADGSPLLGVTDAASFRVVELVGGAWSQVGPLVSDASAIVVGDACPAIAVGGDGTIYAAFEQTVGTSHQARVRRFDGTGWLDMVALDGAAATGHIVADLDLAIDGSGDPVVAFLERNPAIFGFSVTIRRLVAGAFVLDGPADTSRAAEVRIAVRPDDTVVALISRSTGPFGTGIGVVELSGGTWIDRGDVDGVGDTSQQVYLGDVAVDATRAWVTSAHAISGVHTAHVSLLSGGAYTALPGAPLPGMYPELAVHVDDDLAWVRSVGGHLEILAHDGTAFGAPVTDTAIATLGRLAWDHDDLYLAYTTVFGGGSATAELRRVHLP